MSVRADTRRRPTLVLFSLRASSEVRERGVSSATDADDSTCGLRRSDSNSDQGSPLTRVLVEDGRRTRARRVLRGPEYSRHDGRPESTGLRFGDTWIRPRRRVVMFSTATRASYSILHPNRVASRFLLFFDENRVRAREIRETRLEHYFRPRSSLSRLKRRDRRDVRGACRVHDVTRIRRRRFGRVWTVRISRSTDALRRTRVVLEFPAKARRDRKTAFAADKTRTAVFTFSARSPMVIASSSHVT